MKIFYQVYHDWTESNILTMKSFGFTVEEGYSSIEIPYIKDNLKLFKILDSWGAEKFVATIFDKEDYLQSSLFFYIGTQEFGYPQPEDIHKYLVATYNLNNYCSSCGIGAIQDKPFRIKKSPNSKIKIFDLIWVYDEIFVQSDFYERVFSNKYGIGYKEIVLNSGKKVTEAVQLDIKTAESEMELVNTPSILCNICGRIKFEPNIKGFIPGFTSQEKMDVFKSVEFFGTGNTASKRIFFSRSLYEDIMYYKIKSKFWPVDPTYIHKERSL